MRRPSPSLVLSIVAVCMATVSTAAALPGANTVRSDDILNGQVRRPDVRNNAISGIKVQNDTLTGADILESSLAIAAGARGPAGGDLVGTYPNPQVGANAVGSAEVALESLGAADLAANSVGVSEIAANAVGSTEVLADSLAAADLAAGSVGASEIAAAAVGNSEIAGGAVHGSELGAVSIVQGSGVNVANNDGGSATVSCPAGTKMLAGGGGFFGVSGNIDVEVQDSLPTATNAWTVYGRNTSGVARVLRAVVFCLSV